MLQYKCYTARYWRYSINVRLDTEATVKSKKQDTEVSKKYEASILMISYNVRELDTKATVEMLDN